MFWRTIMAIAYRKVLYISLIVLTVSALMLYFTGLIPSFGEWYSYYPFLRMQSDALLRGDLAIKPVPYGIAQDLIWANGMHQGWGLGVPIIQLPFNIVSKLFGFFGFPDRLIFILFYAIVATIFCSALNSVFATSQLIKDSLINRILFLPVILFTFLNPGFITMLRTTFFVYEEVVAYAYLWSVMCVALLIKFILVRKNHIYLTLCILSGFAVVLRPTHIAYGMMIFLIGLYFARLNRVRYYWIGIPLFFIGILFFLTTNYLRFGEPLEFGNSLQLLKSDFGYYVISFDNPSYWFPYKASVVELLSALFFLEADKLYLPKQRLLWQTNDLKGLQLMFKPYNIATLFFLLLGWIVFVLNLKSSRKEMSNMQLLKKQIIRAMGILSLTSFIMLFIFYARYPVITSRYLIDFDLAIIIGILTLYLAMIDYIHNHFPYKLSMWLSGCLCIAFSIWIFNSISSAVIARLPFYSYLNKSQLVNATNAETSKHILTLMSQTNGPPLPDGYRCRDIEYSYGVSANNDGWDISNSCTVKMVSTHFMDNPMCIAIDVEPLATQTSMEESLKEIEVKVGIERFERIRVTSMGQIKTIEYCSKEEKGYENPIYKKYKVVKVKWFDLRKHRNSKIAPIKLINIRKVK